MVSELIYQVKSLGAVYKVCPYLFRILNVPHSNSQEILLTLMTLAWIFPLVRQYNV